MKLRTGVMIVVLAIAGLLASSCEQRIRPSIVEGISAEELPDQESWESTIIISRDGLISAVIQAGYIAVYSNKKITLLDEGVRVDFYNNEGQVTSTLTSDRGEVDDENQNLSGYGNVVIRGDDGTVLETEEIHWENATERIHTDAFVTVISPEEIIQGYGLESDKNLSNYVIYRVTGQTRAEPQRSQ